MARTINYFFGHYDFPIFKIWVAPSIWADVTIGYIRPSSKCLWFDLDIITDRSKLIERLLMDGVFLTPRTIRLNRGDELVNWGLVDQIVADANKNYQGRIRAKDVDISVSIEPKLHLAKELAEQLMQNGIEDVEYTHAETYGLTTSRKTMEVEE